MKIITYLNLSCNTSIIVPTMTFQDIIFKLQSYWSSNGCVIVMPQDQEVGAGTFNPKTVFSAIGPNNINLAYVQPSRRPCDGRYGENPNRVYRHHQFQVILKPDPKNVQQLYLNSLNEIGIDIKKHDIRFIEDDWESPTLGAKGLGWEVWCDSMEISQFTYFQKIAGITCSPITVELTYGLERIAMYIQGVNNVYDILWGYAGDKPIFYRDLNYDFEREFSAFNFDYANVDLLKREFEDFKKEVDSLVEKGLVLPAYEHCIKASHVFNILDSRNAISHTERTNMILLIRSLVMKCCDLFLKQKGLKGGDKR